MGLETRLWGNKTSANLFTTIPRIVRDQLGITPDDRVVWRLDGSAAELRRLGPDGALEGEAAAPAPKGHVVYKQARSNSIYVAIPVAVQEQLRFTARSRAEWELLGSSARIRRS